MRSSALQDALRRASEREAIPATGDDEALFFEPDPGPLLDLVAAAWLVDENIYDAVVCPRLSGACPPLKQLARQPEIESVPRMPDVWRVRDGVRERRAADWMARVGPTTAQEFFEALADQWRSRAAADGVDPSIPLFFELRAASPGAEARLQSMFEEAESRFDLDRCRQLLLMLPSGGIGSPLMDPLRRRLAARSYFAGDWYKTARYYHRAALHNTLESFIHDKDDAHWLLPVHAAGGTGKTMMLRACIARHLVPNDVLVARVDFDFIVWRHLELSPWLVLLPIAEQLAVQIQTQECFRTVFQHAESWRPWLDHAKQQSVADSPEPPLAKRNVTERAETSDKFASIFAEDLPADKPVVLIFDTTEEPYLHGTTADDEPPGGFPRGPLPAVMELLEKLNSYLPALRVIFSGRYDLFARRVTDGRERIPGLEAAFGKVRRSALEVRGFSLDETRSYLRESCRLDLPEDVEEAIFDKARGAAEQDDERAGTETAALPFDVALWACEAEARKAEGKPGLSAEEIRNAPGLRYPIERVVARIQNRDVQWLVRYAIVPQRLTEDFLKEVLLDPLRDVVADHAGCDWKDRGRAVLDKEHPQWEDLRFWEKGVPVEQTVAGLWKALVAYAAGPEEGWLEVVPGTDGVPQVRFHPKVMVPLRDLLEKEEIWAKLQQRAAAYFLKRAGICKDRGCHREWAEEAAMSLFHAFQESRAAGSALWRKLREDARGLPWYAVAPLGEMVLGNAGFEPGERRRPLCGRDGNPRVSPDIEQEARELTFRALLWQAALTRQADIRLQCLARAARCQPAELNESLKSASSSLKLADAIYKKVTTPPESIRAPEPDWWKDATPDAALAIACGGVAEYAAHTPGTEVIYDGLVHWSERYAEHLPRAAAAVIAARVSAGDGRIGGALRHWQIVLQEDAPAWRQAADWLGERAEDLQLACGFECSDGARPDLARQIGEALADHQEPRIRATALSLLHFAAHRMGKMFGPGGLESLSNARAELSKAAGGFPDRDLTRALALLWLTEGITLMRAQDFAPAMERFREAQELWLKMEDYHSRYSALVAQSLTMLEIEDLHEARVALESVPRGNTSVQRRLAYPWQVTSITAAILLAHCREERVAEEWELACAALPEPLQGRRGPHVRAELEAARLAAGQPVVEELLTRLKTLPDAATRAAALWPLKFAKALAETSSSDRLAAINDLFRAWIDEPGAVPEYQLPHLVSLADLLRVTGLTSESRRALSHVLNESTRLDLPWICREAMEAADRAGLHIHAAPPLMEGGANPVTSTPFGARLLLETAVRTYGSKLLPEAWRDYLARARAAPAYPTLQKPPHSGILLEFEAVLAEDVDYTPAIAIDNLHRAATVWDEMEHASRARSCRERAARLRTGSEPASSGVNATLQAQIDDMLNQPLPMLQIVAKGSPPRPLARFMAQAPDSQGTDLPDELPPWLLEEGPEALSRMHYRMSAERPVLFEMMGRLLAHAQRQEQGGPEPPWPDSLCLASELPLVMSLPWECVRLPGPECPLPFILCRLQHADGPSGRLTLIRWVQNTLNRLAAQPPLVEDGIIGPITRAALAVYWSMQGNSGSEPRMAEVLHRMALSLAARPETRHAVSVTASQSLTGTAGDHLLHEMREAFDRVLPGGAGSSDGTTPVSLACLLGPVEEHTSSSETVLDTRDGQQSAASLARLLDHRADGRGKCVVVIQVPLSGKLSPQEHERHLLRRNLFAHRLYSTGSVLAVIASAIPDQPNPGTAKRAAALADIAARGGSLREAVRLFHETEGPLSPFGGPATALWAAHPDLPLLP